MRRVAILLVVAGIILLAGTGVALVRRPPPGTKGPLDLVGVWRLVNSPIGWVVHFRADKGVTYGGSAYRCEGSYQFQSGVIVIDFSKNTANPDQCGLRIIWEVRSSRDAEIVLRDTRGRLNTWKKVL